jgi:hypothetical protein
MVFDSELHGYTVRRGKAWARFNRACDRQDAAGAEAAIREVRYWQRKEKERKARLA